MSAALITTDNVVYLATYRLLKKAKADLVAYKNSYLRMTKEQRAQERARVTWDLLRNEQNVLARLKQQAQGEVDNG